MSYDFTLSLDTDELIEDVGVVDIKRALVNTIPWLTLYCTDVKAYKSNTLYDETNDIVEYFDRTLSSEGEDIHNFAEAILVRCDGFSTVIKFRGCRDD